MENYKHRCNVTVLCLLILCLWGVSHALHARADAAGDKKRAQLAKVKRVIVVQPFFGTETLGKAAAQAEVKDPKVPPDPHLEQYAQQLRQLEDHARTRLPERVAARTPFEVVPARELEEAFKDLKLTPAKLFQNNGVMKGSKFALPDPTAIRKLSERLKADAVILGTMDEPRRVNGHYILDLYGLDVQDPHVRGKGAYCVLLADGTEVLHDYIEVLQPLSRLGHRDYVLADWIGAEDLVIENLMDEFTRYTPDKKEAP